MIDIKSLAPLQRAMLGLWLLGMTVIDNNPHEENYAKESEGDLDWDGVQIDYLTAFKDFEVGRMNRINIADWLRANVPGFKEVAG